MLLVPAFSYVRPLEQFSKAKLSYIAGDFSEYCQSSNAAQECPHDCLPPHDKLLSSSIFCPLL